MKKVYSPSHIVFFLCLIAAFCVGILVAFHTKEVVAADHTLKKTVSAAFCVGKKACTTSPLSIFSKEKLAQIATAIAQPGGFCLQVPVLLYHHIQPQSIAEEKGQTSLNVDSGIFDQQMGYLATKGYHTISAEELVNALTAHTQLPANSIVVTMDDGYLDNYVYAYPVMQKYHLIGNLMVPTGLLGNTSGTNSYYSWDQLKEMVGSGIMFAYNHTWSHYAMASGPTDKDIFEMKTAQEQLQQHLGKVYPLFVYPYGSGQTLGWVQQLVKANGFVAAFSTLGGRYDCEGNILYLPRIHIGNAPLSSYGF